uniref:Desumoylating isopeptidase 1 n=1 Tax=Rhizophora mucronata TaxID=61149 RepID=A0A2P2M4G5_RHIMU
MGTNFLQVHFKYILWYMSGTQVHHFNWCSIWSASSGGMLYTSPKVVFIAINYNSSVPDTLNSLPQKRHRKLACQSLAEIIHIQSNPTTLLSHIKTVSPLSIPQTNSPKFQSPNSDSNAQ